MSTTKEEKTSIKLKIPSYGGGKTISKSKANIDGFFERPKSVTESDWSTFNQVLYACSKDTLASKSLSNCCGMQDIGGFPECSVAKFSEENKKVLASQLRSFVGNYDSEDGGILSQISLASYQSPENWEPVLFEAGFRKVVEFRNKNTENMVSLYQHFNGDDCDVNWTPDSEPLSQEEILKLENESIEVRKLEAEKKAKLKAKAAKEPKVKEPKVKETTDSPLSLGQILAGSGSLNNTALDY